VYDLEYIESQLKKRLPYKNLWFRKQDDLWDKRSAFIYDTLSWDSLVKKMEVAVNRYQYNKKQYFYYTINRWYNYWSAMAVEQLFTQEISIKPNPNPKSGNYDFIWNGIPFDHKTSVFPKSFRGGNTTAFAYAKANPEALVTWLYKNQSTGQRFHLKNRLFIVVYANDGAHYKIKAEIGLFKTIIQTYISTFDPSQLIRLQLQPKTETLTDIIWATV